MQAFDERARARTTAVDAPPDAPRHRIDMDADEGARRPRESTVVSTEIHGSDPEAAAAMYAEAYESTHVRFEPIMDDFAYSYRVTGDDRVTLRSSSIAATRSGSPRGLRQYILGWSNQHTFTVDDDAFGTVAVDRGVPIMLPLGRAVRVSAPSGTMQFVHIDAGFLEDVAALMTGEPPESLSLPVMVDADAIAALRTALCRVVPALLCASTDGQRRSALDVELGETILRAFAPFRDSLDGTGHSAVNRAKDAMLAQYARPLTVADVAEAAGVSVRTLQQAFLGETGAGPMHYLHELRLAKCRLALRRANAGETVAEVARTCGFRHMGRFAGDYVGKYDEYPSDTIRRHW
ncbi:helix-turn-helix transcriptional regulator [Curtobacterium ammoniigenes]|uniref:helix-turn-helix transcriptional regulator n=1 Tax=Curtobacterium ammoniigenes TaxID=395387 RepID=UPI00082CEB10|nr:helix-turn-helix transcriptional regulator [Curtobacterium ammoniigenes]